MKKILAILSCLILFVNIHSQTIFFFDRFSDIENSICINEGGKTLEDKINDCSSTNFDYILKSGVINYNLTWIENNKIYLLTYEPAKIQEKYKRYEFANYNLAGQENSNNNELFFPCKERNLSLYCRNSNGWKKVLDIRKDYYKPHVELREFVRYRAGYGNNEWGGTVIQKNNGEVVVKFLTLINATPSYWTYITFSPDKENDYVIKTKKIIKF